MPLESKVGMGTAVEISLPRFIGDLDPLASAAPADGHSQLAAGEVVLVVEDEDVVRLLVAEVLSDLGFRALETTDGPSALRILQSSQRIDLLITDIGLPDVNGRQVDASNARISRYCL